MSQGLEREPRPPPAAAFGVRSNDSRVPRRGRQMRLAGSDPARERPLRAHRDGRLDPGVAGQFGRDQNEAVLVHPRARDAVAEGRAEEPQDRPRRPSGTRRLTWRPRP